MRHPLHHFAERVRRTMREHHYTTLNPRQVEQRLYPPPVRIDALGRKRLP